MARKNIQFGVTDLEHAFMSHLATANGTTMTDIFRAYIEYLMKGGDLVGYKETVKIICDPATGEIRIPLKGEEAK
ncbi:MAG: hypothetical protein K6U04_08695 [Armatimonadetes bacterium]|nr:hypothetical protein [Armatimonadota bacterium]